MSHPSGRYVDASSETLVNTESDDFLVSIGGQVIITTLLVTCYFGFSNEY